MTRPTCGQADGPTVSAWRGGDYDRISAPHAAMGAPALERLELRGRRARARRGLRLRAAHRAAPRAPAGRLGRGPRWLGLHARGGGPAAGAASATASRFVQADLGRPPLPIDGQVDAILSTATFHWVLDHDALFTGLAGALRSLAVSSPSSAVARATPTALIEAARAEGDRDRRPASTWPASRRQRRRLAAAGFVDVRAWLEPRDHRLRTREDLIDYIVTPYLRPATGLPEAGAAAAGGRHGRPPRRPRPSTTCA